MNARSSKDGAGRCFWCPGMNDVANGMAVVARLLAADTSRSDDGFIVHGAWLPSVWWQCLCHLHSMIRMPHGAFSPVYLACGGMKKSLARPIERWLLRRAKKVFAACEAERSWILSYEPAANVEVVDIKKYFSVAPALRNGGPLRILYLGRRHPLKGVEYLEAAARRIPSCELRVVSDASGDEKEKVWEWSDVLCLPSLSENFGLVVAEALERGKRVVVTDGAPAWSDLPATHGIYVSGYVAASPEAKVDLLVRALSSLL